MKIDLLAPRPASEADLEKVKIGKPRIRPRGAKKIHAFLTEEAITLEEGLLSISIMPDEEDLIVFLPHPFTYLLLKLFALRDHLEKDNKVKAPEHAADIYRTIGMMTEEEWDQAVRFSKQFAGHSILVEAASIVSNVYLDPNARGPIETYRLLGQSEETKANVRKIIDDLNTLFK